MKQTTRFQRFLLGNGENQSRKNVIWNMIGSIGFALATMVLTSLAGRMTGEEGGAVFTAAYTLAQQLLTIGYFEVRTFQVTDLQREYEFEDYFTYRLITCGVMLVTGLGYAALSGGGAVRVSVVLLMVLYKMLDGIADVFEGEFQKDIRLDLSGKSMAVRVACSIAAFTAVGAVSGNIVLASVAAVAASTLAVVCMDFGMIGAFTTCRIVFHRDKLFGIFRDCVLLFVGSFFSLYILNSSRFAAEQFLTAGDYYAYSAALFMPANIINLFCGFLFRPALVTLMERYQNKEYAAFEKMVRLLFLAILGVTVLTMAGGALLGIPVLELLYPTDLTGRRPELMLIIIGSGFNAVALILYYILTVMRMQRGLCFGYFLSAVLTVWVPWVLIRNGGIFGAAASFCVLMMVQGIVLGGIAWIGYHREKKTQGEE